MKTKSFLLFILFTLNAFALEPGKHYPIKPENSMTPGSLCKNGKRRRYPEKVLYCERSVDKALKDLVVKKYDSAFGYRIGQIGRQKFKIDHYISLCMGGSNDLSNLWPQHPSIFEITDPVEAVLCKKLSEGKILQKDAIYWLKVVKNDLSRASEVMSQAARLR